MIRILLLAKVFVLSMRRVKYWLYKNDKVLQDRLTDTNKSAVVQ